MDIVEQGEEIEVDLASGMIRCRKAEVQAKPIPPFMMELISEGGLIKYLKKKLEG